LPVSRPPESLSHRDPTGSGVLSSIPARRAAAVLKYDVPGVVHDDERRRTPDGIERRDGGVMEPGLQQAVPAVEESAIGMRGHPVADGHHDGVGGGEGDGADVDHEPAEHHRGVGGVPVRLDEPGQQHAIPEFDHL
jgi:hypothetical protein